MSLLLLFRGDQPAKRRRRGRRTVLVLPPRLAPSAAPDPAPAVVPWLAPAVGRRVMAEVRSTRRRQSEDELLLLEAI